MKPVVTCEDIKKRTELTWPPLSHHLTALGIPVGTATCDVPNSDPKFQLAELKVQDRAYSRLYRGDQMTLRRYYRPPHSPRGYSARVDETSLVVFVIARHSTCIIHLQLSYIPETSHARLSLIQALGGQ